MPDLAFLADPFMLSWCGLCAALCQIDKCGDKNYNYEISAVRIVQRNGMKTAGSGGDGIGADRLYRLRKYMVRQMEERRKRREIDFVPKENTWRPDEDPKLWSEEEEDLERTMVLEPVQAEQEYSEEYGGGYEDGYLEKEEYPDYDDAFEDYEEDYEGEQERRHFRKGLRDRVSASLKPDPHRYGRDPYENLEKEPEAWPDGRESRERVRRSRSVPERGRRGDFREGAAPVRETEPSRAAKPAKSGRAWWKRPLLFRLFSLAFMVVLLAGLGKGFWAEREAFGSVLSALEEGNYGTVLYLLLAAGTMAFGAFSLLWMLSRRRMYWDGRLRRTDVGRGMTSFLLFALLVFVSARVALHLPEGSWFYRGIAQYMLAAASAKSLVYICSGLGILSCILRKLAK